jgi:acylphosphatase
VCKRCVVSGRVQGVFFRVSTAGRARELGVTGSAVNLPDGRVEVILYGSESDVAALCEWLWQGPDPCSVSDVECHALESVDEGAVPDRFSTG